MANSDHIEWLLEGVDFWNAKRKQTFFRPNFEGVNIYELFRSSGKLNEEGYIPLSEINLIHANLINACFMDLGYSVEPKCLGADLQMADLEFARLDGASLIEASFDFAKMDFSSFRDSIMSRTKFIGTNLSQADFTNTQFENADLKNAKFHRTKLLNADLTIAHLPGADLSGAQPWLAKLYRDSGSVKKQHKQVAPVRCISCVADLIEECDSLQAKEKNHTLRAKEGKMLLDLMSRRPEDFNNTSALSYWRNNTGSQPGYLMLHAILWWHCSALARTLKKRGGCMLFGCQTS